MSFMQPPVQQPPQVTQSITIFPNPTAGEFGLVGATAKGSSTDAGASLGPISTADADQPHIRFDTSIGGGIYEIQLPGGEWDELIPYGQGTGPNVATDSTGDVQLVLSGSRDNGYKYSEVASYIATGPQQFGAIAFGTLTAAGGVPVTGSATYSGTVMGSSDVIASDAFDGLNRATVSGSVSLDFDFAAGTLGGAMTVALDDASGASLPIGTFNFKDTVFGVGSTGYSGKFDTAAAGDNFFLGKFTGPNAEETIGAWALPFILDSGNATITADHMNHQLFGAWIAKRP